MDVSISPNQFLFRQAAVLIRPRKQNPVEFWPFHGDHKAILEYAHDNGLSAKCSDVDKVWSGEMKPIQDHYFRQEISTVLSRVTYVKTAFRMMHSDELQPITQGTGFIAVVPRRHVDPDLKKRIVRAGVEASGPDFKDRYKLESASVGMLFAEPRSLSGLKKVGISGAYSSYPVGKNVPDNWEGERLASRLADRKELTGSVIRHFWEQSSGLRDEPVILIKNSVQEERVFFPDSHHTGLITKEAIEAVLSEVSEDADYQEHHRRREAFREMPMKQYDGLDL